MGSGATQYVGKTVEFNYSVGQLHPPAPFVWEDFLGDAVNTFQTIITQSGTPTAAGISATAGDPVAGHGGWLAGATDDVDAEADEVVVGAASATAGIFRADQVRAGGMTVVEWAISVPTALTDRQYFAGFSDDATEGSGALAIIVTTTTVADAATDAAGWTFGSAATDNTHWLGVSTDGGTQSTILSGPTAAADTWIGLRTEIDSTGEVFYLSRSKRGGSLTVQGKSNVGTSADVLLLPYFGASPTTTTAVPWEIDYCFAGASNLV